MSASCPNCGSRYLNFSRPRSAEERFDSLFGRQPLRCQDCRTRFVGRTFVWQDCRFAKCPKCFRMDLNLWSEEHMKPTGWMAFLIALGGNRLRCEYCRLNFVGLRHRKEHFSFHRWTKLQVQRQREKQGHNK